MPDATTRLRELLADRYRIEVASDGSPVVLGAGGMATVFRARDLRHDREVAVKVLHPEIGATVGSERFLREIRVTARLQHPNILPLHDSGERDGLLYYVMPLVEGESLRQRLGREGRLPPPVARHIAREVADALGYAHRHGVLHRDVKPENILLAEGRVMLADFGIAQALTGGQTGGGAGGQEMALTATGLSIGTPAYMSPEQAAGVRDLDARSDVYAVGCVLYEMLAGEPPFSGGSLAALIAARFAGDAPPLRTKAPAVPPALEEVVARALARDPAGRFATAAELVQALDAASASPPFTPAPTLPVGTPAARAPRIRRWAVIGGAVLLLAALIAVGVRAVRNTVASDAADPVTLAVLPFRDLAAPQEATALRTGIPDAIITRMSGIRALRVRPTAAILRYEDRTVDPQVAGRELGADYVLAGTVQRAGTRFRVGVQLIRVGDNAPVWGSRYDLDRADLLGLQDSIARRVGTALEIRITAAEERRLYRRYTDNVEAYELFLQGRAQLARLTREATLAAVAAFERALALDSAYTPARAGLAMASADMHLRFASGDDVKRWGERAEHEARRALELDSTIADAYLAMAAVARKTEFNWEATLEAGRRALALNPSLEMAHYFRAAAFYHLGLLPQASAELAAAVEINPQPSVEQIRTESVIAFFSGDFERAARLGDEVRRASGEQVADFYRAEAYLYAGDTARAWSVLDSLVVSSSASSRARGTAVVATLIAAREPTRARALVDTLLARGYLDHHVTYALGTAYAQLGEPAAAVQWLERSAREGFACYPWFVRDPFLNPIRADPGFARWLAAARGRWEALQRRYPVQ